MEEGRGGGRVEAEEAGEAAGDGVSMEWCGPEEGRASRSSRLSEDSVAVAVEWSMAVREREREIETNGVKEELFRGE